MTSTAPAKITGQQAVAQILNRYAPVVHKLLDGTGTSEATFLAQIANACRVQPKLWACEPETVLGAALRCAQLALPPNDGNNLSWIIPYKTTATFQLGYGGVMELARRAEPGLRFDGRPVYPGDLFTVDYGKGEPMKHVPHFARKPPRERGGDAVAWYVRAIYPSGETHLHVLDRTAVEYHRSFSKKEPTDDAPWVRSYDAMALKSVVLDMKRWLPNSRQLAEAIAADGTVVDVRDMENVGNANGPGAAGEIEAPDDDSPPEVVDPEDAADAAWVAEATTTDQPGGKK